MILFPYWFSSKIGHKAKELKIKEKNMSSLTSYLKAEIQLEIKKTKKNKSGNNKNQCSFCPYVAKQKRNLSEHINKIHEKIWRYKCSKCDFSSYGHNQVKDHQRRRHADEKEVKVVPLTCEDCGKKILHENCPRKRKIKHHRIKPDNQDKEKLYKCDEVGCEIRTLNQRYLVRHKRMKHLGIENYRCSKCDFRACEKYCVQTHCKSHKDLLAVPMRIGCSLCSEDSECVHQNKDIENKEQTKKENKKEIYICNICEFLTPFDTVKLRRIHYRKIHPGQFIYNCSDCNYGANYLSHLKVHKNSMHEKIRLTCNQCDFTTLSRSLLLKHCREQHGTFVYESKNISKEPILCDECGYSSFSNLLFKRHNCNRREPDGCLKVNIISLNKIQRQA